MNFPFEVEHYLNEQHLIDVPFFYALTNSEGLVKAPGNLSQLLSYSLIEGEPIGSFMQVFTGLFPMSDAFILSKIQLLDDQYFNIYLYPLHNDTWIFLKDVSGQVKQLRSHIVRTSLSAEESFALLEQLGFLVLKKYEEGTYLALTFPEGWAYQLFASVPALIDLENHFPYLSFYIGQNSQATYSGIWTQTASNGNELHLNAWLAQLNGQQVLLVQPVKLEMTNDQIIIQMARENRLAFEQLMKTKEQLQELHVLKDQFVSIVSHDFRSPISTLTDGVSLLIDDLNAAKPFDQSHREIIEQVRFELIRLLNYNNKLYNWVKLNMASIELNITRVPIDLMLANLNGQYDGRLNEKQLRLQLVINQHVELDTDYILLSQALSTLLDNAIKFSEPGSEIVITLNEHSLVMTDYGAGMPKAKVEEILKGQFLKSTRGTIGETGTGLGLNIVLRILKILNLTLHIESESGKGSSFIISF